MAMSRYFQALAALPRATSFLYIINKILGDRERVCLDVVQKWNIHARAGD